jgi:hypothetical protein
MRYPFCVGLGFADQRPEPRNLNRRWRSGNVQLDYVRSEIERMRNQVGRQRKEILLLQRAGIPTASAEAMLQRMLDKIEGLCAQRDKLKAKQSIL